MERIYVEAIVALILFLWSLYNIANNKENFDPLWIGAFIQMLIALATAFITWLNSLGG